MFWKNPRLWCVLRTMLPLLLTLLWLGFIFSNSLKDAAASSEQSGKVHEIVNEVASAIGVEEPISEESVRTLAHLTEFAILGTLLCLDIWALGLSPFYAKHRFDVLWLLTALPACFLLACIDEILQTFAEGRACDFRDVLTDTEGAALGVAVFLGFFLLCRLAFGKKKALT